jgi:nitroreductase
MELTEATRTTFAARDFTPEPVTDEVIYRILDNARFAPSGGNRQGWRVIVVRDPATKARLGQLAIPGMQRYLAQVAAGESPWNTVHPTKVTRDDVAKTQTPPWVAGQLANAPVVLVIGVDRSVVAAMDQDLDRPGIISGASIYPFAWNILLGARNEGLAGNITTAVAAREPEAQAFLGMPPEVAVAAVMPLGWPARRLTKLRRKPVEAFVMRERWGGEPLTAPPKDA